MARERVRVDSGNNVEANELLPPSLPTARAPVNLPTTRLWSLLFLLSQSLSVIPSFLGILYALHRFTTPSPVLSSASLITLGRSTRLDWAIGSMWALACAHFSHSMARGLLRRWLVYYSLLPTVIRVLSLQAICWPLCLTTHRVLSFDQPVAAWLVCATTAALSNVVQIWVTSNIATVEMKHQRGQWLSAIVSAVVGPGVRSEKFEKSRRVFSWKKVLWGTILPFAIMAFITTNALLWQQYTSRYHTGTGLDLIGNEINYNVDHSRLEGRSEIQIILLVTSSWTARSTINRQSFRQSTLKTFPPSSTQLSIRYKFLLGTAPSPQAQSKFSAALKAEEAQFGDLLFLPSNDRYEQLSEKIWWGWRWAARETADYVLKTDDDVFLRMEIISKELKDLGRRDDYWRGFAYWNIPAIIDPGNKNSDFSYSLPIFPPYTAGALHILSHNLVRVIAPPQSNSTRKLFVKNEDQALGIWLFPTGILPIHDHRIQQGQICTEGQIAKHFGGNYIEENNRGPIELYQNIKNGRKMCEGFNEQWCGVCAPSCWGKENHWRDWGFACDVVRGASLSSSPSISSVSPAPVRIPPSSLIIGSVEDPWVVPGLLSHHSSAFSNTDDWHLLHMLCWTTPASTFQERHYQAMETIWVNEPRAVLIVMATLLPLDFFDFYTKAGYQVEVVRIGGQELQDMGWYLGDNSRDWLKSWDKWEKGPYFFSHLTDYLRYLFLYKFGGTYLDMDAPWIRSPPSSTSQFIGADFSTNPTDFSWTLSEDGMYLAPGVMRFKQGWTMFEEIMERFFQVGVYDMACFNCVGPKAITVYVKEKRKQLEEGGLDILKSNVFYPKNWVESGQLVMPLGGGIAESWKRLEAIEKESWSIHLFGKMTNHLEIHPQSIVGVVFDHYSLKIPRTFGQLSTSSPELGNPIDLGNGIELMLPGIRNSGVYHYRDRLALALAEVDNLELLGSIDGKFEGLNLIFIRGVVSTSVLDATLQFSVHTVSPTDRSSGRLTLSSSSNKISGSSSISSAGGLSGGETLKVELGKTTLREVNTVLGSLRYLIGKGNGKGGSEEIRIQVKFGKERIQGSFKVVLP